MSLFRQGGFKFRSYLILVPKLFDLKRDVNESSIIIRIAEQTIRKQSDWEKRKWVYPQPIMQVTRNDFALFEHMTYLKHNLLYLMIGLLFVVQPSWCHDLLSTTIIVDESKIIREIPEELFGFNHNWIQSERLVWSKSKMQTSSELVKILSGLPLPLNRMSGSVSQVFHWKQAIGSLSDRVGQQLAVHDKRAKKYFGPLEWIESTRTIDPQAKFSWVFNMKTEKPSDHADLIEFLTSDGVTNYNGGVNWGKKRIEYGLKKPVPVKIWELGNQMDRAGQKNGWSLEEYTSECEKIINAVRSVAPNSAIAIHAATNPMGRHFRFKDWRKWHRTVLKKFGNQIDYIAYHAYYSSIVPISMHEKYLDIISDDILKITGNNRIKIYISEHAFWPTKPKEAEKRWEDKWYQTHSLSGSLLTAQFLNRLLQKKEIVAATYHCFSSGPWGLFYPKKGGGLYRTGIYDTFSIVKRGLGRYVVNSSIYGSKTNTAKKSLTFTVTAMSLEDGINFILVNREAESKRKITFQFNEKYSLQEITTMSANSLDSYNSEYDKQIFTKTEQLESTHEFNTYTMPAKSITVLKLVQLNK